MADFEQALNSLLSNPDAMGQILNLAQNLGGGTQQESDDFQPQDQGETQDQSSPFSDEGPFSGFLGGMDPQTIQMILEMLGEFNRPDDPNVALLQALRPFLKEKRQAKVERAIQITKFSRLAKIALAKWKEGGHSV